MITIRKEETNHEFRGYRWNMFQTKKGVEVKVGELTYSCGLQEGVPLKLNLKKDFSWGATKICMPESPDIKIYHLKNLTPEQQLAQDAERDENNQKWEDERQEVYRKNREATLNYHTRIIKEIKEEKDLDKCLEIISKFSKSERLAGRIHLGEYW